MNHRDLEKRCHEDAHAIRRAPETTRNVAISRKGNPPIRDIAISLEHACEIGTNMARTERNISLKGASSPLLKHHDRLTAEHSVSAIGAQELAVSTASCAVARAALDVRYVRALFARWRPGDLHLRRNVLSRPLSRPLHICIVTRRRHRLCFCKTRPLNAAVRRAIHI